MKNKIQQFDLEPIRRALKEGSVSGYKLAVLEIDKIFQNLLENRKYLAQTEAKKFEKILSKIKNPEKLIYARTMKEKICREPGFDIGKEDTEEIVKAYWQAIIDINRDLNLDMDFKDKIIAWFRYFYPQPLKILKKFSIWAGILVVLTIFLSDTSWGRRFAFAWVEFVHFIIFKALVVLGIIIALGLTIFGAVMLVKHKIKKD